MTSSGQEPTPQLTRRGALVAKDINMTTTIKEKTFTGEYGHRKRVSLEFDKNEGFRVQTVLFWREDKNMVEKSDVYGHNEIGAKRAFSSRCNYLKKSFAQ